MLVMVGASKKNPIATIAKWTMRNAWANVRINNLAVVGRGADESSGEQTIEIPSSID
jgi:hypothetical protein